VAVAELVPDVAARRAARYEDSALDPRRQTVAFDSAVVVEPQQLDHVAHVCLVLDPAGGVARLAGEDGVVADALLIEQLLPDPLGEADVKGVVPM
jgi:hypothetical protein